jgi:hypothetical protein
LILCVAVKVAVPGWLGAQLDRFSDAQRTNSVQGRP